MGDPAGVGPEIVLRAMQTLAPRVAAGEMGLIVLGNVEILRTTARMLGMEIGVVSADAGAAWPRLSVVEVAPGATVIPAGRVSAEAGRLAYAAVARGVELCLAGEFDAIATAPLNKEALNLAGYKYAGHTDMLAALTKSRDSCMMLAHDRLIVTHVSTHVALARVPSLVTRERVTRVIELTVEALDALGIARPRIAVSALNPHAGEGGIFGSEDADVLMPVIQDFRVLGFDVSGPHPGDTVFVKAAAGQYDAVIAMYHDQGHIPVKLLGFKIDSITQSWVGLSGVNVTLGLPIIRTSVDHGTAFDIAGKGIANPQSMIEAIEFAVRLARGRATARETGSSPR